MLAYEAALNPDGRLKYVLVVTADDISFPVRPEPDFMRLIKLGPPQLLGRMPTRSEIEVKVLPPPPGTPPFIITDPYTLWILGW